MKVQINSSEEAGKLYLKCLHLLEVSLSELGENDSSSVTKSFDSMSYLLPMANLRWWLAEVTVMSRLRCYGNSAGERLCCNSFPQLPGLHK